MNNNNSSIQKIHIENDNNNIDLEIIQGKPDKEIFNTSKSNNQKVKIKSTYKFIEKVFHRNRKIKNNKY